MKRLPVCPRGGLKMTTRLLSRSAASNRSLAASLSVNFRECTFPIAAKTPVISDLRAACSSIKSGDNVFVQGIAATPTPLLNSLCKHVKENNLTGIRLHHLHLEGPTPWTAPDVKDRIRSNSLFTGHNLRKAVNDGTADFNSCFLNEVPLLFRRGAIRLNAALIQVTLSNKNMPRTLGDSVIHSSHFDVLVEDHEHQLHPRPMGELGDANHRAPVNGRQSGKIEDRSLHR
ncbi:Acetyl-CoA deacylase [Aphelenchoides fujianensis]|nr:Acetyl-CoA deacylase [Aphelenchoides fujianensis]